MNTKGPRPAVAVTVVDLDSGETRSFPSIAKAAAWMRVDITTAREMVYNGKQYLNWYCYPTGEDRTELIEAHRSRYKHYQKPVAKGKKAKAELVSLRIDAKTVIMVTPDKATPEYAEQWRQRHQADAKHTARYERQN